MPQFTIDKTVLHSPLEIKDNLTVSSKLGDYHVFFKPMPQSFSDSEIVFIDKRVRELYGIKHKKLIEFEALEKNKSMASVLSLVDQLLELKTSKKDRLVIIGGGITQEVGAFAANLYKRGLPFSLYPTTLLAQCDSCLGGKAGLNHGSFKNQLGVFASPKEVIVDFQFLDTLPKEEISSGMGEIIKVFLMGGEAYLKNLYHWSLEEKVKQALALKKAVIEQDEFEAHERKALNLGHSYGHVIEALTNFTIPHGEAVLLGIEIINQKYEKNEKVSELISQYTHLDKINHLEASQLHQGLLTDKKTLGNTISLVRLRKPGEIFFAQEKL